MAFSQYFRVLSKYHQRYIQNLFTTILPHMIMKIYNVRLNCIVIVCLNMLMQCTRIKWDEAGEGKGRANVFGRATRSWERLILYDDGNIVYSGGGCFSSQWTDLIWFDLIWSLTSFTKPANHGSVRRLLIKPYTDRLSLLIHCLIWWRCFCFCSAIRG